MLQLRTDLQLLEMIMKQEKKVRALRDRQDAEPTWEIGTVIGDWHENRIGLYEQSGVKNPI